MINIKKYSGINDGEIFTFPGEDNNICVGASSYDEEKDIYTIGHFDFRTFTFHAYKRENRDIKVRSYSKSEVAEKMLKVILTMVEEY